MKQKQLFLSLSSAAIVSLCSMANANPQQSTIEQTQSSNKDTWIDDQQHSVKNWVDDTAQSLDNRLSGKKSKSPDGADELKDQAHGTLKVYLDNDWSERTGFNTRVRVRGKVHLPRTNERFNIVFGDDRLDDERTDEAGVYAGATQNSTPKQSSTDTTDFSDIKDNALDENASIALRYAAKTLDDYKVDLDLGIRSGSDIYVRATSDRKWQLEDNLELALYPTARYGTESKLFLQTVLNANYYATNPENFWERAQLSTALSYAEPESNLGALWHERFTLSREFKPEHRIDYGAQVHTRIKDTHSKLSSYGVYASYRQPVWRDWFYIRGDAHYLTDRAELGWHPTAFIRLEAHF